MFALFSFFYFCLLQTKHHHWRSLQEHLEADEYHSVMQDPETVIIDVRNAYESAIGAFNSPEGGAKLIDPKMRNSIELKKVA
jgi:predicted sulfurtransferase